MAESSYYADPLEDSKPLLGTLEHGDPNFYQRSRPDEEPPRATRLSISLMIAMGFLTNFVASIVMPTLPQYLESLGAPGYLNGWVLSVTGVSTAISNPILGYWSDRRGVKEVTFVAVSIAVVANIWYSFAGDFRQVIASRFLGAIAFGLQASANSYLSYATSMEDRAMFMTLSYGLGALGFICGASLSAVTNLKIFQQTIPGTSIHVNKLTLPGYIAAFLYATTLIPLIFFKNVRKPPPDETTLKKGRCHPSRLCTNFGPGGVSFFGVISCLFFVFATLAANASFVTMAPLFTTDHLDFSTLDNSLTFLSVGIGSVLTFVVLQGWIRIQKDERINMLIFGSILTLGYCIMIYWTNIMHGVIRFPQFVVGLVFYAIGITASESFTWIVYSKLLEGTEQGVMMGWIGTTSAAAGILCPVLAAYAYKGWGPNVVFLFVASLTMCAVIFVAIFFKSLKPRVLHDKIEPVVE